MLLDDDSGDGGEQAQGGGDDSRAEGRRRGAQRWGEEDGGRALYTRLASWANREHGKLRFKLSSRPFAHIPTHGPPYDHVQPLITFPARPRSFSKRRCMVITQKNTTKRNST